MLRFLIVLVFLVWLAVRVTAVLHVVAISYGSRGLQAKEMYD
jgi:hypothetical protein